MLFAFPISNGMDLSEQQKIAIQEKLPWHAKSVGDTLEAVGSNRDGLSVDVAQQRLLHFGKNELPKQKKESMLQLFLKQFNSMLLYILFGAAFVSFIIGHYVDAYIILAVVLINVIIGFIQERRAEKAIESLNKLIVLYAKVFRNGVFMRILTTDVVPGDVIFLEEGDNVPADARLFYAKNLKIEEALLTGESFPVEKDVRILKEETQLGDRKNMVWMGTSVVSGNGKAVVTTTSKSTAFGDVAQTLEEVERPATHFEKRTEQLAFFMAALAVFGAGITFIVGFFYQNLPIVDIFLFSVASLVSGIPEGLPAILIIVLAVGSWRMARRNAAVRHLPSSETLGVTTVIATDKTGTITQNSMTVERIALSDGTKMRVTGEGYKPTGDFILNGKKVKFDSLMDSEKLLRIAAVCNNGRTFQENENYQVIGDPTEAALYVLAEKAGLSRDALINKLTKYDELPFNRETKYRAMLVGKKSREIYVVGAFENILSLSKSVYINGRTRKITQELGNDILQGSLNMAENAYRVIAVAYKKVPQNTESLSQDLVKDLVWVGAVGIIDPPKPEVKVAIAKAHQAGIRVIMKTGDHKQTALAIAKQIGLINKKNGGAVPLAYTENDLNAMTEDEFSIAVRDVSVFARVTPRMKMRLVEELQKQGHIVAMTGDGVNDAPALKKAHIGIAMGKGGTDVAREASEIVLVDDNFATIVSAIEQGRIIFHNVRQTSFYFITTNIAEDITIITTLFMSLPLPLLPIHVLWLNLVTDTGSGLALAAEPGHEGVLLEPPRRSSERLLSWAVLPFGIMMVVLMVGVTLFLFTHYLGEGIEKARTVAFTFMALSQSFNAFNMRTLKKSIFRVGIFSNRYLLLAFLSSLVIQVVIIHVPLFQNLFRFAPLSFVEWVALIALGSLAFWLGEVYKFIRSKFILE